MYPEMFSKENTLDASSSGTNFDTFGNTTSPFGQSFTKPAAFSQPAAFGTQNTGSFGTPQTSFVGLFNNGTSSSFGSSGAPQTSIGGFNQPPTSNTLFGIQTTLFGQNNTKTYGVQSKPAFRFQVQSKPAFRFNQNQPNNVIFGQTTAATSTFCPFGTQTQNTSVFGSVGTTFGQTNANAGSSIAKYKPSIGTDTFIKNGQSNSVSTKQHCITAMIEYENKSFEEIRFNDYFANRKGNHYNIFGQISGSADGTTFGQTNQTANAGSSIAKYKPSIGTDTFIENGQSNSVSTKQHCITAMKEYENKSFEEIRFNDYLANRKGNHYIFGQTSGSADGTIFGQTNQTANAASSIAKYTPSIGTDTFIKNGHSNSVSTKQHCITAMKEYENISIEEIRFDDYLANRKGNQGNPNIFGPTSGSTGLFGTNTQQGTVLFGQAADNKFVFGTTIPIGTGTTFGQNQNTGLFSKSFTTPGTNTFGGFRTTDNAFRAKPAFNQTEGTNLFGQSSIQTSTAFGQTPSFNTFGAGNTQPSLFGNTATDNKGTLGLSSSTSSTGFSAFGNNSTTNPGLFGKPAGFGTNTDFSNPASANAFRPKTFDIQNSFSKSDLNTVEIIENSSLLICDEENITANESDNVEIVEGLTDGKNLAGVILNWVGYYIPSIEELETFS